MLGQSLSQWWQSFTQQGKVLKLRYVGWDHRTRFFTPKNLSQGEDHVEGVLDNGEVISFPVNSDFWVQYDEGMEEGAKAV